MRSEIIVAPRDWIRRTRILVGILLFTLGAAPVCAQDVQVENLTYAQKGTEIVLTYDLLGEDDEEYDVEVLLSGNGGVVFDYRPQAASGDVGDAVEPGLDKQIVWDVLQDKPGGLQGNEFQFKVTVEEVGRNWWWYGVGSTVLTGGLTGAAVMIFGGSDSGDGDGGIPTAPSPPN